MLTRTPPSVQTPRWEATLPTRGDHTACPAFVGKAAWRRWHGTGATLPSDFQQEVQCQPSPRFFNGLLGPILYGSPSNLVRGGHARRSLADATLAVHREQAPDLQRPRARINLFGPEPAPCVCDEGRLA